MCYKNDTQYQICHHQILFFQLKMHQNLFFGRPGPRWGSLRRSPDPLVGWGGVYPSPFLSPLDAFGVSNSALGSQAPSTQNPGYASAFTVHKISQKRLGPIHQKMSRLWNHELSWTLVVMFSVDRCWCFNFVRYTITMSQVSTFTCCDFCTVCHVCNV